MIKKSYHIHIFKDSAGLWRWRMKSGNGRIVADSAEGYSRESAAYDAAEKLLNVNVVIVRPRAFGRGMKVPETLPSLTESRIGQ